MTQVQIILSIVISCIVGICSIFFGFWKIGRDLKADFEKKKEEWNWTLGGYGTGKKPSSTPYSRFPINIIENG